MLTRSYPTRPVRVGPTREKNPRHASRVRREGKRARRRGGGGGGDALGEILAPLYRRCFAVNGLACI